MDIHVELRYDGFNSVQQIGYTSVRGIFLFLASLEEPFHGGDRQDEHPTSDFLEIQSADVFGVSQGGMIAQYLAIDRPDLVNKLVLAVTLSKNNETVETVISDWIRMTEQNDIKNLVKDMAEKMYTDSYVRKYKYFMPLLTILQKPKNVPRFITLAKACLTCNAYDELDKIQCPVFVIGGMQDKITGGEASMEIAEKLGCKSFIYDDLGHAAYEEAKDFNQRVYDFFMI